MRRYLLGFVLVILAALGASFHDVKPALAACPSPLTGKDAGGTTQNFGVTVDGSGNCYGNIGIVDGSNAANKATVTSGNALKVDASATTQPVSQSGSWAFTCSSGCSSSSNQIIAGQANYPLQVNQVQSLITSPLGSAQLIWDGQHYLSLVPPNGSAQQAQAAVVVRNPDTGNIADAAFAGSGSASQIAVEKGIYTAVTSSIPFGSNTIGKVDILGNAGTALDVNGQNASSIGINELLVGGQFNATPTPISSGNISPLQLDANGNLLVNVKANSFGTLTVTGTVAASQVGAPWSVTGTSQIINNSGQGLGGNLPGQVNIPFVTSQAPTSLSPFNLLPSTGLWDGKNYASFAPPNSAPQAWQPALVVTLSPNSPSTGGGGGNVNVTQFGSNNVVTGTGTSGLGIPRVTVSSDSSITANQGGAPWADNITQVAGNAVSTSASGQLKVGIVGNAGAIMDFAGQAAAAPANSLLVGAEFQNPPTTLTAGQASPLQMDSAGNLLVNVKAGGGSGGTSSTFGAAFPSTGTAIGAKNGTNMVNLVADNSGNLDVNCAVGCSASSFADQSGFTFGTTAINTIGGVYSATPNTLASGTAGAALLTAGRILQENRRDSSGQELGASLRGQANIPVGVAQVQTALSTPFFPATGLWDGKNYASFAPAFGSVIASQAALITALSPNSPLPAGTNTLGAVTQSGGPWSISGTVTANQGGTWTVQQGGAPWSVSQATASNLNATVVGTGTFAVQAAQSGTWTVQQGTPPWTVNPGTAANWGIGATGSAVPANAVLEGMSQGGNTTALTGTSGNLNVNLAGNSFGTLTVSGTVTANQGTANATPWNENVAQFGGTNVVTGTGASGSGIPRVTVSNDSNILATQSGAWTVAATQSGTWTVQQGTPPWNIVNYDTGGRQLGASLAGANNVPFVTTQALTTLAPASLLPSYGLWDGQHYASFTGPNAAPTALNTALVVTHSPNSTIGATQSGTWTVQQGGAPWSVSQSGSPWGVSIQQGGNTANVNGSNQLLVNCGNCSGSGVSQVDNTGFTFGTTSMAPIGGVYSSAPTPLTNGDAGAVLLTQGRILEHNTRNSAGQELGQSLPGQANIPLQVNIASQVTNNTLLKQSDSYGQPRVASMLTDGTQYASLTVPGKPAKQTDSAIVVAPSPVPTLQCPFIQALNASATATVITGQAGKFLHVCSYKVVAAAALSFTLNEGTGTTCGTGTTALDGGGSGSIALAANGGFQTGSGAGQVTIPMQKAGDNLCVQVSASSVSGYINYGIFN